MVCTLRVRERQRRENEQAGGRGEQQAEHDRNGGRALTEPRQQVAQVAGREDHERQCERRDEHVPTLADGVSQHRRRAVQVLEARQAVAGLVGGWPP